MIESPVKASSLPMTRAENRADGVKESPVKASRLRTTANENRADGVKESPVNASSLPMPTTENIVDVVKESPVNASRLLSTTTESLANVVKIWHTLSQASITSGQDHTIARQNGVHYGVSANRIRISLAFPPSLSLLRDTGLYRGHRDHCVWGSWRTNHELLVLERRLCSRSELRK